MILLALTSVTSRTLLLRLARPIVLLVSTSVLSLLSNEVKLPQTLFQLHEDHGLGDESDIFPHSCEPHPPVPSSPCTCHVSTTPPQTKRWETISSTVAQWQACSPRGTPRPIANGKDDTREQAVDALAGIYEDRVDHSALAAFPLL